VYGVIDMPERRGGTISGRINAALEKKFGLEPIPTGTVTERISVVNTDTANFYVYRGSGAIACFDTGYRPLVAKRELQRLGIDPGQITHVFLTHADIDHVGGLRLFKNAALYLSADEERMIKGRRSPWSAVRSPRIRRQYQLLRDGDTVQVGASAVRAIATPGHTPGSMAYLLDGTYLFIGDTCRLKDGQAYAGKHYTMDYETQKESIRKLALLENVGWVFTGHSGCTDDFEKAFAYWKQAI
jgi:glyoxylase-like metal-dependent hydrolase (beta-lactamase superfamily II)